MRSSAENYIARDKAWETDKTKQVKNVRQLDKSLPVDESPVFEASDDFDNEEFINANDPEKKFVPIEEVADPDSDFLDKEEEELESEETNDEEAEDEEVNDNNQIEEVRKSIGDYTFKQRGSKFSNLESFHVDHDKGEMLAVGANAELTAEDVEEREDEFELAEVDNSEAKIGKMSGRLSMDPKSTRTPRRIDNLKTWNDDKRQRAERGAIREFIDQPLESSEDIKREEELEKITKDDKSLWRKFLDRLN